MARAFQAKVKPKGLEVREASPYSKHRKETSVEGARRWVWRRGQESDYSRPYVSHKHLDFILRAMRNEGGQFQQGTEG